MTAKVLLSSTNVEIIISSSGEFIVRCDDRTEFRVGKIRSVTTQIPANSDGGLIGTWTSVLYRRGGYDK